ncbi:hypothetical protein HZU73_00604 [Apis mellifera caucasica]|uniref:Uncharacterized protein LOC409327 isoform X1 n=2 Tax=Apis mellifera TaxID=7460 RepID=A0A7M7MWE2_APIME|nr:uncharacterized protein LOC409327 isoform X1 [Apis mellifera]XP_026302028.1 uncharacterized protein LOC409327 isoform X1 [Apis mellifera]KAG6803890.1 hypothetical protein HZU73_00604 [Apis mellifera caucasica]KAG9437316.1 hypothetical protein HZU67_00325 [Apis mellifera carnica]|eukprot:XP_026302023.1 uncharacterized protein LOC409327 isoform X1 [Apis mellifera]
MRIKLDIRFRFLHVARGRASSFKMITALPVPSVKVFHKTYYQEKGSRIGNSQPGSPLAESEAVLALVDKEPPEYYFCGKVNSLHVVVGSLLLGAVVLVVGLVQLAPGAEAAQNSTALIVVGCSLLVVGVFLAPLRALCIKRQKAAQKDGTHQRSVTSIDMLLAQHRDFTVLTPDELEDLVGRPTSALENKIRKQGQNT